MTSLEFTLTILASSLFLSLAILVVYLTVEIKEIKNLRNKNSHLSLSLSDIENQMKTQYKKIQFALKNKPKYPVGKTIKHYKVTGIDVAFQFVDFKTNVFRFNYKIKNTITGEEKWVKLD